MDPSEIEIKSITTTEPKLMKKKSFQYVTIPLRNGGEDQKLQLLFNDAFFKIYESDYNGETTFSLGIGLKGENDKIMQELETKFQSLAMKNKPLLQ